MEHKLTHINQYWTFFSLTKKYTGIYRWFFFRCFRVVFYVRLFDQGFHYTCVWFIRPQRNTRAKCSLWKHPIAPIDLMQPFNVIHLAFSKRALDKFYFCCFSFPFMCFALPSNTHTHTHTSHIGHAYIASISIIRPFDNKYYIERKFIVYLMRQEFPHKMIYKIVWMISVFLSF